MKISRLSPLAGVVLAATLALAGCSGSSDEPTDAASSGAAAQQDGGDGAEQTAGEGIVSPDDLPEEPAFDTKAKGVIKDVAVENCETGPGDVAANGTATNSGKFARDIVVTINWAVSSTSDVVARGVATLEDVEPGESADWEVESSFDVDEPVGCVPTARAGQLR